MPHEFPDAELYPCDICGEVWPLEEMFELEYGRFVCAECLEEIEFTPEYN